MGLLLLSLLMRQQRKFSAIWWISLSLLTENNAVNKLCCYHHAEKDGTVNCVNSNREHCESAIVLYRDRCYCRHYNHILVVSTSGNALRACNYSLLVVASRKASFT